MPMVSVNQAQLKTNARIPDIIILEYLTSAIRLFISVSTRGFIHSSITTTKRSVSPKVRIVRAKPLDLVTATTNARMHQAVTSSIDAQANAVEPSGVSAKPRSLRIRARTGKAVMLIAIPMNSANAVKEVPGVATEP